MNVHNPALSLKEAADLVGRSKSTLLGAIHRKRLVSHKVEVDARHRYERRVYLMDLMRWRDSIRKGGFVAPPEHRICREKLLRAIEGALQRWNMTRRDAERAMGLCPSQLPRILRLLRQGKLPRADTLFALLLWLDEPLESLQTEPTTMEIEP